MNQAEAIPKYGLALTDSDWAGLPMRAGHFPSVGSLDDLTSPSDTVLLWIGSTSKVDIAYRDGDGRRTECRFERKSGMIDVLPRSVSIDRIRWRNDGGASSCVSVTLPVGSVAQLLGDRRDALPPHVAPSFAVDDPHAADLIARLHAQVVCGTPLGAAYVQGLSLTLVSYVLATYGQSDPANAAPPEPGRLPRGLCEALMVFVEDFLSQDIGLIDMAAVVGYSPDHFGRLFRQAFHASPYQYLLGRRIERAKAMLRDPSLPIASIATACGFTSQSHLNTMFKRLTGTTPGRYRRT